VGNEGDEFNKKFGDDLYTLSADHILLMLSQAMANAKSTDPVKVAAALRPQPWPIAAIVFAPSWKSGEVTGNVACAVPAPSDAKYPYSPEGTGMTLVPVKQYESYVSSTPTSCQMKRPG